MIISVVSQKGGVGKSALARTLAAEFTKAGWNTLLADCDHLQATSLDWSRKRSEKTNHEVKCKLFRQVSDAIKSEPDYDLVIIDGSPHATRGTAEASAASNITIIATGSSLDDLKPGIALAKELNPTTTVFAMMQATSDHQVKECKETIREMGFTCLDGAIYVRTGYIEALDDGLALTETKYDSLNKSAVEVIQSCVNLMSKDS